MTVLETLNDELIMGYREEYSVVIVANRGTATLSCERVNVLIICLHELVCLRKEQMSL